MCKNSHKHGEKSQSPAKPAQNEVAGKVVYDDYIIYNNFALLPHSKLKNFTAAASVCASYQSTSISK